MCAIPFGQMKQTARMAKALAKANVAEVDLEELRRFVGGPEFGHISQEYLFSTSALPLSIILQFFGQEGCCKSTLALAFLSQFFLEQGGEARLLDTEQKLNLPLVQSLVQPEAVEDGRFKIDRPGTLEDTQSVLMAYAKQLEADTFGKKRDSAPHMLGMCIDSYRVSSEVTQKSVTDSGHASKAYAVEAQLWRQWLTAFTPKLQSAPMSLFIVNHQVEKEVQGGYGKQLDVGGGMALKFFETYRILVRAIQKKAQVELAYTDLALTTYKNSNGPGRQTIYPRVIYRSPDIPAGRTVVDWDIADARLMSGSDIPRSKLAKAGVCDIKESSKAGLYNDLVNDIKMAPIQEIMSAIYADESKLAELRKILNIQRIHTLEELYEDGWFKDARCGVSVSSGEDDEE